MNRVYKIMVCVTIFLLLEVVGYYLFYAIIPMFNNELFNSYEYSMAIIYSDFNKVSIVYIAVLITIVFEEVLKNKKCFVRIILSGLLNFIGLNILISDFIFISNRFGHILIKSIEDFQKYFGVIIYFGYGIILVVTSVMLIIKGKNKDENSN